MQRDTQISNLKIIDNLQKSSHLLKATDMSTSCRTNSNRYRSLNLNHLLNVIQVLLKAQESNSPFFSGISFGGIRRKGVRGGGISSQVTTCKFNFKCREAK